MAEKEESGSKLDALLERIPVLDGGGRRRLTAGTITLLTLLVAFSDIWPHIKEAIAAKDTSISLFLVVGALLIYATGVLVELMGEIFLARAVGNAVWSYVEAAKETRRWRPSLRPSAWPYIIVWGSIQALGYFFVGLFGKSHWRMRLRRRLSANARSTYDKFPYPVRLALTRSLGAKAEFGRMALIELVTGPARKRWARTLMERPKDVLALVSALVISLLILLVWSPIRQDLTPAAVQTLEPMRLQLDKVKIRLVSARDEFYSIIRTAKPQPDARSLESLKDLTNSFDALVNLVQALHGLTQVSYLRHTGSFAISVPYENFEPACDSKIDTSRMEESVAAATKKLDDSRTAACKELSEFVDRLHTATFAAYRELFTSAEQQAIVRFVSGIAALFLYVAFFNTLTSVTLSVIEAIALEGVVSGSGASKREALPPVIEQGSLDRHRSVG